jgi:hypothetical protein
MFFIYNTPLEDDLKTTSTNRGLHVFRDRLKGIVLMV